MPRWVLYLAWAWEIVIGGLLITPGRVLCITCGQVIQAPGYIGRPLTVILGLGAIILGVIGIVATARAKAGVVAAK